MVQVCTLMAVTFYIEKASARCLFYAAFVECLCIFSGIVYVFLVGFGEVVGAAEILLGAHVEIVVMNAIEHSIDTRDGRNADRAGREPRIFVGVVGALDGEQIVVDTFEFETLPSKFYRGVSLQRHAFGILGIAQFQAVVVHACNHGFLAVVGCFLINNAGQGYHLVVGQS